jgi:hypothetical protein
MTRALARLPRPDLSPVACLDFEAAEVWALHWLPLAVRYKLDLARARLSLNQWQALPLRERERLLQCELGDEFSRVAFLAGATPFSSPVQHKEPLGCAAVAAKFDCSPSEAQLWLACASPFALYVLGRTVIPCG